MKKPDNVVKLFEVIPVATCPQCDGQSWFIKMDGMNNDYSKIIGFECADEECGFNVDLEIDAIAFELDKVID